MEYCLYAEHKAKIFTCIFYNPQNNPMAGKVNIPILQVRILRLRDLNLFTLTCLDGGGFRMAWNPP